MLNAIVEFRFPLLENNYQPYYIKREIHAQRGMKRGA